MSAELALLNKINNASDMITIDSVNFDFTRMMDLSSIFPDMVANFPNRKVVLMLPDAPPKLNLTLLKQDDFGTDLSDYNTYGAPSSYILDDAEALNGKAVVANADGNYPSGIRYMTPFSEQKNYNIEFRIKATSLGNGTRVGFTTSSPATGGGVSSFLLELWRSHFNYETIIINGKSTIPSFKFVTVNIIGANNGDGTTSIWGYVNGEFLNKRTISNTANRNFYFCLDGNNCYAKFRLDYFKLYTS